MTANLFRQTAELALAETMKENPPESYAKIQEEYLSLVGTFPIDEILLEQKWQELQDALYEDHPEFLFPFIVNASFACELYLKAIHYFNGTKFPKSGTDGHNLEKLFDLLPIADKQHLVNSFQMEYGDTFDLELSAAALAFLDWRYWFEADMSRSKRISILFLENFCSSLYSLAKQSQIRQGQQI